MCTYKSHHMDAFENGLFLLVYTCVISHPPLWWQAFCPTFRAWLLGTGITLLPLDVVGWDKPVSVKHAWSLNNVKIYHALWWWYGGKRSFAAAGIIQYTCTARAKHLYLEQIWLIAIITILETFTSYENTALTWVIAEVFEHAPTKSKAATNTSSQTKGLFQWSHFDM